MEKGNSVLWSLRFVLLGLKKRILFYLCDPCDEVHNYERYACRHFICAQTPQAELGISLWAIFQNCHSFLFCLELGSIGQAVIVLPFFFFSIYFVLMFVSWVGHCFSSGMEDGRYYNNYNSTEFIEHFQKLGVLYVLLNMQCADTHIEISGTKIH